MSHITSSEQFNYIWMHTYQKNEKTTCHILHQFNYMDAYIFQSLPSTYTQIFQYPLYISAVNVILSKVLLYFVIFVMLSPYNAFLNSICIQFIKTKINWNQEVTQ